jgi:hypothetical protein
MVLPVTMRSNFLRLQFDLHFTAFPLRLVLIRNNKEFRVKKLDGCIVRPSLLSDWLYPLYNSFDFCNFSSFTSLYAAGN